MIKKLRDELYTLARSYGTVYSTLCAHNAIQFVLYCIKIYTIHVLFEVLITVSYMTLVVFYSPDYGLAKAIPMSTFFSQILFTCAIIYSIVTILFLFVVLLTSMRHVRKGNKSGIDTYSAIIMRAIIGGLSAYIIMGILTAIWPEFFSGVDGLSLGFYNRAKLAISIALFGFAWFTLSYLRYKRINWYDAIKVELAKKQCTPCESEEGATDKLYNLKTLSFTFASAIAQALIICIIIIFFIKALMDIPPTQQEDFNFFNLTLAVFFAIISTYITFLIRYEYARTLPGFSICICKKNNSKNAKQ